MKHSYVPRILTYQKNESSFFVTSSKVTHKIYPTLLGEGLLDDFSTHLGDDFLNRAKVLARTLASEVVNIENLRHLTPSIVNALVDGGFYKMLLPQSLGGAELSVFSFMNVIEEIAQEDASTAWCLAQCATCAMSAAYLERDTAMEIFGPADSIIAWGPFAPAEANIVSGGYRVSGSWNFASGGRQAKWLGGQCNILDTNGDIVRLSNGAPVVRMMLFHRDEVVMSDTWKVMGLKGTGSDTYSVKNLFVPDRFSVARDDPSERRETGTLYRFSTSNVYSFAFAAVALGISRRMLDDVIKLATTKKPGGTKSALRDNNVVQSNIGRSEACWRAARKYLYSTAKELWEQSSHGQPLSIDQKIELRLSSAWAIHQASSVADVVYHMAGSTAVFENNSFERRFRDIHTVTQQIQGRQSHYENVGQVLLGLEPDAVMFTT